VRIDRADVDGDGYGACPGCDIANGCTFNGDDCDDFDGNINPGNDGTNDYCDCDDLDGFTQQASEISCLLTSPDEDCDGLEDCEEIADCENQDCFGGVNTCQGGACLAMPICTDNDGDGYGVCPNCDTTSGCVFNGDDCDDDIAQCGDACNPGASDYCDGWDNDCNAGTADGSGDPFPHFNSKQADICAGSTQSCVAGVWVDDYSGIANYEDPEANCIDAFDNDCDGGLNCGGLCASGTESDCGNGIDDDNDCLTDCADPECTGDPACPSGTSGAPGFDMTWLNILVVELLVVMLSAAVVFKGMKPAG